QFVRRRPARLNAPRRHRLRPLLRPPRRRAPTRTWLTWRSGWKPPCAARPHLPRRAARSHTRAAEERLRKARRRDGVLAGPSQEPFVKPPASPRRVLFFLILTAAGSLADPALAQDISINLGQGGGGVTERAIQLIALLTVLSIAPSILIMMTSFTRIVVVLSLLRTALGTATAPPNSVIIALAMFLTAFVMGPVLQR